MPLVLYIASVVGALGLLLMLPKRRFTLAPLGAVLGAAALGGVWLAAFSLQRVAPVADASPWYWIPASSGETIAILYYYVFSAIAIGAAARVITHTRPVYSALWFIMVILASAGLFLTLSAEFMAFAMVIIYAGAILVTYVFVIMLATQSSDPDFQRGEAAESADYDRLTREPIAAVAAGFLMLAVLLTVSFEHMEPNAVAAADNDAAIIETTLPHRSPLAVARAMQDEATDASASLAEAQRLSNAEAIGLDLFASHPLGLELAGVILTVALIGAVVIARTRVPEEEQTAAAYAPPDAASGASVRTTHEPGPSESEAIGELGGRMGA